MKCPHCSNPLVPQHSFCAHCGFSDSALGAYLGNDWVRLERLTDRAHCLRLEETRQIEILLDDFERQFPQSFLAIYLGALPPKLNPLELGMWLLNHGAFSTHQFAKRNDFGIVCVIDPAARRHGIALGYALESILQNTQVETLLTAMVPALRAQQWAAAVQLAITDCSTQLRQIGKCSHRRVETSPPPAGTGLPSDYGFSPLRAGHRKSEKTSSPRLTRRS
jgi:hypothetical protein